MSISSGCIWAEMRYFAFQARRRLATQWFQRFSPLEAARTVPRGRAPAPPTSQGGLGHVRPGAGAEDVNPELTGVNPAGGVDRDRDPSPLSWTSTFVVALVWGITLYIQKQRDFLT